MSNFGSGDIQSFPARSGWALLSRHSNIAMGRSQQEVWAWGKGQAQCFLPPHRTPGTPKPNENPPPKYRLGKLVPKKNTLTQVF